jgi:tRNA (Thr-GGU) A37 N-methylase
MIRTVVVTYQLRPDAMDEHVRLIEGVFAQLATERPATVDYQVMRLADGVSFVHVSTSDTADGTNPLTSLAAFQAFNESIAERVATMPNPSAADLIGSYRGEGSGRSS